MTPTEEETRFLFWLMVVSDEGWNGDQWRPIFGIDTTVDGWIILAQGCGLNGIESVLHRRRPDLIEVMHAAHAAALLSNAWWLDNDTITPPDRRPSRDPD